MSARWETIVRDFRWKAPSRFNIAAAACDRHARADRSALLHLDDTGTIERYTFRRLRALSNRLANGLNALGIATGDRVAICLPVRPETAICHLAVYKLGAIAVPLSPLFGPEALEVRLADACASIVFADDETLERVAPVAGRLPGLRVIAVPGHGESDYCGLIARGSERLRSHDTAANDPALLLYTSGTSGPPKGVLHAHRVLIGHLPGFRYSHNLAPRPGDLLWGVADWSWVGGLLCMLLAPLAYGIPVLVHRLRRFDPERALWVLARHGVRNFGVVPSALRQMAAVCRPPHIALRSTICGGEPLDARLFQWARETLGVPVNEIFGQTEASYIVGNSLRFFPPRPGSIGRPYPGHRLALLEDTGRAVTPDATGEIAVARDDPALFLGYWHRPDATAAKFRDGWYLTGDVARVEDGVWWFAGRKDDVIKSSGYRVGPEEVEAVLAAHPAVLEAAVVGVPHAEMGQIVHGFVVLRPGASPSDTLVEELRGAVKARLAPWAAPRAVTVVDSLPRTVTGKLMRSRLRQWT